MESVAICNIFSTLSSYLLIFVQSRFNKHKRYCILCGKKISKLTQAMLSFPGHQVPVPFQNFDENKIYKSKSSNGHETIKYWKKTILFWKLELQKYLNVGPDVLRMFTNSKTKPVLAMTSRVNLSISLLQPFIVLYVYKCKK